MTRRLAQLALGLAVYGLSLALLIRSSLGNAPWDVLHQGAARHLPITVGQAVVLGSFVVLLLWIPLRERPGVATVLNALTVGLFVDVFLVVLPASDVLAVRIALLLAGVFLCALATALYLGARLGSGPRDGLMTGLHRRTGLSLRLVRTGIEVSVVVLGFALGGTLGVGTAVFALTIGPLAQWMLPWFASEVRASRSASGFEARFARTSTN